MQGWRHKTHKVRGGPGALCPSSTSRQKAAGARPLACKHPNDYITRSDGSRGRTTSCWGLRWLSQFSISNFHPYVCSRRSVKPTVQYMVHHETSAKVARHFDNQHQAKESCALPSRLLLYAPPGFGKTMFVRGLANQLGVEYTIMNGGDIAPLERDAITELHK